ncbi:MAG: hypothetical protein WCJ01_04620 [Ignavibacteria bacterium]
MDNKNNFSNGEKEKITARINYAGKIIKYLLTENLQHTGCEINNKNVDSQAHQLALDVLLYCGANEGVDFYSDEDIIKSAISLMSEGEINYSNEETEKIKERINNWLNATITP